MERKQMLDVTIEIGPIYWIHNQTFVPTTTTTTTTSTTTTTEPTTTSQKAKPLVPPIEENEIPSDQPDSDEVIKVGSFGSLGSSQKLSPKDGKNDDTDKDTNNANNLIVSTIVMMAGSLLSILV